MVQVPAPVRCAVEPDTVHLPLAVKLTGKPDDADALSAKSGSPKVLLPSSAKVIDCGWPASQASPMPFRSASAWLGLEIAGQLSDKSGTPSASASGGPPVVQRSALLYRR